MASRRRFSSLVAVALLVVSACGDDADDAATAPASSPADSETSTTAGTPGTVATEGGTSAAREGIWLVPPAAAAASIANPPDDLVVLDVRTPEEFADGHIDGAVLLDFYRDDFAEQLARLDPDVPYVLYCRSGNRSGQTASMMQELGFSSVEEVDGGIVEWQIAGLPVVAGN